jgi:hypothetical protein
MFMLVLDERTHKNWNINIKCRSSHWKALTLLREELLSRTWGGSIVLQPWVWATWLEVSVQYVNLPPLAEYKTKTVNSIQTSNKNQTKNGDQLACFSFTKRPTQAQVEASLVIGFNCPSGTHTHGSSNILDRQREGERVTDLTALGFCNPNICSLKNFFPRFLNSMKSSPFLYACILPSHQKVWHVMKLLWNSLASLQKQDPNKI